MSTARVLAFVLLGFALGQPSVSGDERLPMPKEGVVRDEATAVQIAEIVFAPVFGKQVVDGFRPYRGQLKDGVWTVYGTLKRGSRGGTPMLKIRKSDGRVLGVWHSG